LSAFRPRRWRGALLPRHVQIRFDILEHSKRPVSAVADNVEVRDVSRVDVAEERDTTVTMLFDPGHSLDDRILDEQFFY
jgi:NAD+ kinase